YVPVSGEGAHLIRAIDVLGNVAEATYYTSFGFNNVLDQLRTVREDTSKKLDEMMKKLPSQVDVDKLADAVAERLKPELSRSGSNQMGDMAFGLAIVAVAAAVAAFAIAARRGRKV
ncbi:MAG: hypothetical protein N3H84_06175, partial [Candidatus Caldarchaeum sp.]|nr:hypothetical protein [Candidatus Caldarchaeum sp.]